MAVTWSAVTLPGFHRFLTSFAVGNYVHFFSVLGIVSCCSRFVSRASTVFPAMPSSAQALGQDRIESPASSIMLPSVACRTVASYSLRLRVGSLLRAAGSVALFRNAHEIGLHSTSLNVYILLDGGRSSR